MLGYPQHKALPQGLLDRADEIDDDGHVLRRRFRRATLWDYADTGLGAGTTAVDGPEHLDRRGVAERAGVRVAPWTSGSLIGLPMASRP